MKSFLKLLIILPILLYFFSCSNDELVFVKSNIEGEWSLVSKGDGWGGELKKDFDLITFTSEQNFTIVQYNNTICAGKYRPKPDGQAAIITLFPKFGSHELTKYDQVIYMGEDHMNVSNNGCGDCESYYLRKCAEFEGEIFRAKDTVLSVSTDYFKFGNFSIRKFNFYDEMNGFAIQGGNYILKTDNGGAYWATVISDKDSRFTDIHISPNKQVFAYGKKDIAINSGGWTEQHGIIYRSSDYGLNWHDTVFLNDGPIYSLTFATDMLGLFLTNSRIFRTIDGGNSWHQLSYNPSSSFQKIHCISENIFFIIQIDGAIIKTSDAGNNWTIVRNPDDDIYDMAIYDENTMLLQARQAVFYTTDGLKTLHLLNGITHCNSVHFVNENTFYTTCTKIYKEDYCILYRSSFNKCINWGQEWICEKKFPLNIDVTHFNNQFLYASSGWGGMYKIKF